MQVQTKKTLICLLACLPFAVGYFLPIQPDKFTYMFVHANIFHLMANVVALFLFLKSAGNKSTFITFLIGGLCTSVVSYMIYGDSLVVGASGFVFGVVGIYMVFRYRGIFNKELYKSFNFASVVFAVIVGMFIPSLAGLLHLYAFVFGLFIGQLAISVVRFIRNLQQYM